MQGGFGFEGAHLGHRDRSCHPTHLKCGKMHGSEGRSGMRADHRVVIADDADVLRAPLASLPEGIQRAQGHHVIVREDGSR